MTIIAVLYFFVISVCFVTFLVVVRKRMASRRERHKVQYVLVQNSKNKQRLTASDEMQVTARPLSLANTDLPPCSPIFFCICGHHFRCHEIIRV